MGYDLVHKQKEMNLIYAYMSKGQSVAKAVANSDVSCGYRTFWTWLTSSQDFRQDYARAESERALFLFEECLTLADAKDREMYFIDKKGNRRIDTGMVQWIREQIATRKWFLAKFLPRKYADKLLIDTANTDLNRSDSIDLSKFKPDTLALIVRDLEADKQAKTLTATAIQSGDVQEAEEVKE